MHDRGRWSKQVTDAGDRNRFMEGATIEILSGRLLAAWFDGALMSMTEIPAPLGHLYVRASAEGIPRAWGA